MKLRDLSAFNFRTASITFILLSLAACATQRFARESGKVQHLKEIAIVVDVTVTHGRTIKDPILNVAENESIAARLGAITADVLRAKGYLPLPPVRAVGMAAPARLEVIFGDETEPAAPKPVSPPFLLAPTSDAVSDEHIRTLFTNTNESRGERGRKRVGSAGKSLPPGTNPFGAMPVVLINAQGYFISGGAVVANVGKGALNTIVVIGMAAGGGGGGNVKFLDMDKDNLALTFRMFEPIAGVLIWQDQFNDSGNADEAAFAKKISEMLAKLPDAVN
ncbi:MAG: hypothetical protein HZB91_07905 [Elusimicrobia bacterium]|nr:hypothetical protein [Elusimicrobiota bacterium]